VQHAGKEELLQYLEEKNVQWEENK
jgi:hypothetical protein